MRYQVRPGVHAESLKGGRMVGPGDELSEAEAEENPKLLERGVVIEVQAPEEDPGPEITDPAKKLAEKHGIDLATLVGTGARGRIVEDDVKKAIEAAAAAENQPGDGAGHQPGDAGERGSK